MSFFIYKQNASQFREQADTSKTKLTHSTRRSTESIHRQSFYNDKQKQKSTPKIQIKKLSEAKMA